MDWGRIKYFSGLFIVCCLVMSIPPAEAAANPPLSGTYQVVQKSQAGDLIRVTFRVHLVNHVGREVRIQRITLWDFAHPARGGSQACTVALSAGSFADTTQEFTIPRAEYELWKRGSPPRVVLEIAGPAGHSRTEVVRLERASGGEEN